MQDISQTVVVGSDLTFVTVLMLPPLLRDDPLLNTRRRKLG